MYKDIHILWCFTTWNSFLVFFFSFMAGSRRSYDIWACSTIWTLILGSLPHFAAQSLQVWLLIVTKVCTFYFYLINSLFRVYIYGCIIWSLSRLVIEVWKTAKKFSRISKSRFNCFAQNLYLLICHAIDIKHITLREGREYLSIFWLCLGI